MAVLVVLIKQTHKYSLFLQREGAEDVLDFWLDVQQHENLCRAYFKDLKKSGKAVKDEWPQYYDFARSVLSPPLPSPLQARQNDTDHSSGAEDPSTAPFSAFPENALQSQAQLHPRMKTVIVVLRPQDICKTQLSPRISLRTQRSPLKHKPIQDEPPFRPLIGRVRRL